MFSYNCCLLTSVWPHFPKLSLLLHFLSYFLILRSFLQTSKICHWSLLLQDLQYSTYLNYQTIIDNKNMPSTVSTHVYWNPYCRLIQHRLLSEKIDLGSPCTDTVLYILFWFIITSYHAYDLAYSNEHTVYIQWVRNRM